jgi:hypothetical protein
MMVQLDEDMLVFQGPTFLSKEFRRFDSFSGFWVF